MIDVQKEIVDRVEECIENLSDYHRIKMGEIGNKLSSIFINMIPDKGKFYGSNINDNEILIDYLNDDCLLHIFQYLPIADRVRIERVCRRWQNISKKSWHNFNSLNLYRDTWGLIINNDNNNNNSNNNNNNNRLIKNPHAVHEILIRCGRYLKKLQFLGYTKELSEVASYIGILCPNLQYLELSGARKIVLQNIAENCRDIKSLYLRDTLDVCEDELSLLFSKNKKLEFLELVCEYKHEKFWLDVPVESLRSLNILNCDFSSNYFNQAARKMKNLSKISFDYCHNFNDESMRTICSIASLEEIQTGRYLPRIGSLKPIANVKHLKKVELSYSDHYVNDELLIEISKNCLELADVDISGCCMVTDVGVAYLTLLSNLERLILNDLEITAKAFHVMPKLKELECVGCVRIGNKCFSRMIETSEQLELLNVCDCKVNNATVTRAVIATKKRTNNVTLRMYVEGNQIQLKKKTGESPLLKLIFENRIYTAKDYL